MDYASMLIMGKQQQQDLKFNGLKWILKFKHK